MIKDLSLQNWFDGIKEVRYRKSYFDQPSWDDVDRFNDIKMDRKVHINNDECVLQVYE